MARLAVVTGASSGISEAYTRRHGGEGWGVVVVARRRDRLDALVRESTTPSGTGAEAMTADLSRAEDIGRVTRLLGNVQWTFSSTALAWRITCH